MSSQKQILCVDDDKDSCELITFMLKSANQKFEVSAVGTSTEAVQMIEQKPFDLYILDYRLPGMSGVELCRLIRQTDAKTPIMFFTAMAYEKDREEAFDAGANVYLVKPNDVGIFTETVENLIENTEKK